MKHITYHRSVIVNDYYDSAFQEIVIDEPNGWFLGTFFIALESAESMLDKAYTVKQVFDYVKINYTNVTQTFSMLAQKRPDILVSLINQINNDENC